MNNIIICTYDPKLLPEKKSDGAVCRDLKIASDFTLSPSGFITIGTGIKTSIPIGRCAKVYARSGLPSKMGLMLANGTAIFDADYRGEYIMQFFNFSKENKAFEKYTRMTQIEFILYYTGTSYGQSEQQQNDNTQVVPHLQFIIDQNTYDNFESLYPTKRGAGKFNSTGVI